MHFVRSYYIQSKQFDFYADKIKLNTHRQKGRKKKGKEQRQNKKEHIERPSIFQYTVIQGSRIIVKRIAVNVQFFSPCFKKALEIFSFGSQISNKHVLCCTSKLCCVS